ncbi:MAG TPA: hypothetical protein PLC24_07775 [Myxococcota bacterium]|nr:hypothetical protein [Myxococcota bacterium]
MNPTAFQIFCGYYLGLDSEFGAKFFNVHSLAAHYGIDAGTLQELMAAHGMVPENMRHIDFNVAKAHGIAQELTFTASREDVMRHARDSFDAFVQAARKMDPDKVFEDIDYDDVWEDEKDNRGNR